MKALSIDPESCMLIFTGEKTIECRSWKTNYRGEILICPTKELVPDCISGHAYFTATLTDIEPFTEDHLDAAAMEEMPNVKCYAWHLDDITMIYPIAVRGMPGLFEVDDDKIKYPDDEIDDDLSDDEVEKLGNEFYATHLVPLVYTPDLL